MGSVKPPPSSEPVGFRKHGNRVELRGTPGGGHGTLMFTLPEGYRPPREMQFPVDSGRGPSIVTIAPNGNVLADPDAWTFSV